MLTAISSYLLKGDQKGSLHMEVVVVVVVVAALIGFIVPTYYQYIDKAKLTLARSTLESMKVDLRSYQQEHRRYPTEIDFDTGKDELGILVFRGTLVDQIGTDFSSIDSYVGTTDTYTLTAIATDKKLTVMTLAPSSVSY